MFGVRVASLAAMEFNLDPDISSALQSVEEEIVQESRAKLETVRRILAQVPISVLLLPFCIKKHHDMDQLYEHFSS